MANEFKEFNDKLEGKTYVLNVSAEVDSSFTSAEKRVNSFIKAVEDGQKKIESAVRGSMESMSSGYEDPDEYWQKLQKLHEQKAKAERESSLSMKASFNDAEVSEWASSLVEQGKSFTETCDLIEAKIAEINEEMANLDKHRPLRKYGDQDYKNKDVEDHLNGEIQKDIEAADSLRAILADLKVDNETATIQTETEAIKAQTEALKDESSAINESVGNENAENRLESLRTEIKQIDEEIKELGRHKFDMDTSELEQKMETLLQRRRELVKEENSIAPSTQKQESKSASTSSLPTESDADIREGIERAKSLLADLKSDAKKSGGYTQEMIQEREAILAWIEAAEKELTLRQQIGKENDRASEEKDTGNQSKKRETQKNIPDGEQPSLNDNITDSIKSYDDLLIKIEAVKSVLQELRESAKNGSDVNIGASAESIKTLESELKNLEALKKTIDGNQKTGSNESSSEPTVSPSASSSVSRVKEETSQTTPQVSILSDAFGQLASKMKTVAGLAASGVFNFTKSGLGLLAKTAKTATSALGSLASKGFSLVKAGAQRASSGITGLVGNMKNFSGGTTKKMLSSLGSIKNMLMRRVKRQFISEIFKNAQNGLQNLAKYSSQFNSSMNSIKNTAKTTAGNLSVTFGNLINTLAPVITAVTSMINSVIVKINELFALFSGKSTVTVAQKATDNYASSANKASKSAKDLNHQLYGFDEITKQEDDKSSGGGSGSKPIKYMEQAISSFAKEIYDAIAAGEWEKAGALLGKRINQLVQVAREKLQEWRKVAVQWADNIARFANGLTASLNFYQIGAMFGDGINLVFDTVYHFLKRYDFKVLGNKLAKGVNGLFDSIEWDLVGKTFAEGFNSMWDVIESFARNAKWGTYGSYLADSVNVFFENLNLDTRSDAISKSINGIVELFNTFIDKVEWDDISKKIFANMYTTILNVNWAGIRRLLSNSINNIIHVFRYFVDSDIFSALAVELGECVGGILNEIEWDTLAETAREGLGKIVSAFSTFITRLHLPTIAMRLANGINTFFDTQHGGKAFADMGTKLNTAVGEIVAGFNALVNGDNAIDFSGIAESIGNGINSFIGGEKGADGEGGIFATAIGAVGKFVKKIAESFWKLVGGSPEEGGIDFENIASQIGQGINKMFTNDKGEIDEHAFDNLISNISGAIVKGLRAIGTFFKDTDFKTIGASIANALMKIDLGEVGKSLVRALVLGIKSAIDLVGGAIGAFINKILGIDTATEFYGAGTDWATNLYSGFNEELSTGAQNGQVNVATAAALIAGGFGDDLARQIGDKKTDVQQEAYNLALAIAAAATDGTDAITGNWNALGLTLDSELAKSIFENSNLPADKVDELFNTLATASTGDEMLAILKEYGIQIPTELDGALTAAFHMAQGDVLEGGKELILALQKAAESEDVNATKEAFKKAGYDVTDEFASQITGAGMDNVAAALLLLGKGIDSKTVEALDTSNLSTNLDNYMKENGYTLEQVVAGLLKDSGASLEEIAKTLGKGVGEDLGFTIPEGVSEGLGKGKELINEAKNEVVNDGKLSEEQQAEMGASGTNAGKETTGNLATELDNGKSDVETAAQGVADSMDAKLSELPEKERKQATDMMNFIIQGIQEGDPLVQEAINTAATAVVEKAKEILSSTTGMEIAKEFLGGITTGISEKYEETIVDAISTATTAVLTKAQEILAPSVGMENVSKEFLGGIMTGISENYQDTIVDAMNTAAEAVLDKAMEVLSETNGWNVTYVFVSGIEEGISQNASTAINAIDTMCNVAIQDANNILSESNGYTIGSNVIIGMINGMNAYGQTLVDTIAHICNVTAETARDILGIHSPSKVFAEIGNYVMEGMDNGLEESGKDAVQTVADLASAIIEEGTEAGQLEANFGTSADGLDTVESKLSRIAQIFADIADVMAEMGQLEIPTVASGKVLPYRAKVDTSSRTETNTVSNGNIEDAVYNAVMKALNDLDLDQTINLNVDGRKMAETVTKYQRQAERAWGV